MQVRYYYYYYYYYYYHHHHHVIIIIIVITVIIIIIIIIIADSYGINNDKSMNVNLQISHLCFSVVIVFLQSPCESHPCQHGGTCRALYTKGKFKCDCVPTYSGDHCQTASESLINE